MTEFPPLFTRAGVFNSDEWTPELVESLPPQRRALFDDVREAAADLERAESGLKAASEHVAECVRAVADAEKATAASRPTFHDLWKATYGRPRQQRAQPTGGAAG